MHLLKAYYDKFLALLSLIVLLVSLVYLAMAGGNRQQIQDRYIDRLEDMVVAHPDLREFDPEVLDPAMAELDRPFQMAPASNAVPGFFVTEPRVWCVKCRRPIPLKAEECPFCEEQQPPMQGEVTSEIDIAEEAPELPMIERLRVREIESTPLPVRFMGRIELPDGEYMAQINVDDGRTYLVREGAPVGDTGFFLEKIEMRNLMRRRPGDTEAREVPVPYVILTYGESVVDLEMGGQKVHVRYRVHLTTEPAEDKNWTLEIGGKLVLEEVEYKLIEVDRESRSVVLQNTSDGARHTVSTR